MISTLRPDILPTLARDKDGVRAHDENRVRAHGPDEARARDLDLLWDAQFGDRVEFIARACTITAGGVGLYFYNGWVIGLIWVAIFFVTMVIGNQTLRMAHSTRPGGWAIGIATYVVLTINFASLPIYMIASSDPVLAICGIMGMMTFAVFNIVRHEAPQSILPIDIAVGWCALAVGLFASIQRADDLLAQVVMGLLTLTLGGYYTMALIRTRSIRANLRIANEREQETQKMEAVGRVTGGIAHDFNTILTTLQGSLELYQVVSEKHERDTLIDEARGSARRAATLIAHLLAFACRAPLAPQALDAGLALSEVASLARALLPPRVTLDLRDPPEPVQVLADRLGLQEALLNLVRNARDAVDGTGTVTLAVDLVSGPATEANCGPAPNATGAHLRFSVADDGPGMAPDIAQRALEPFFTTKRTAKATDKGTGLGLPMAKGFAEQSGGAFRLQTCEDGTIASIHLPIALGSP